MKILTNLLQIDLSIKLDIPEIIFSKDDLYECYSISKQLKNSRYRCIIDNPYLIKPKSIGIYFLLDDFKNIMYIGKSNICIRQRLINHFFIKSKYLSDIELKKDEEKKYVCNYFYWIELPYDDIDLVEILLIKKFQPILNIQYK